MPNCIFRPRISDFYCPSPSSKKPTFIFLKHISYSGSYMYNMLYGLPGVINASIKYRNNILFFLSVNFLGVQSTVMLAR